MADAPPTPLLSALPGLEHLDEAIQSGRPQLYANGMVVMLGTSDITVVLLKNNKSEAVLNLSYTVAKTLALSLGQTIGQLEERTGRDMLTTQEIASKLMQEPE